MAEKAYNINVFGRVQGVGFRFYTHRKAKELDLKGFVQNKPDGIVYIEVEGDEDAVEQFILWCNDGPSWARVSKIQLQEVPVTDFTDFKVK